MKKYENFVAAFENLKDIYDYSEPYGNVELTGLVGLFEVCFEQSWKAMKEILEANGFSEGRAGSPKQILKTAYSAGMIEDEEMWLDALVSKNNVAHAYNKDIALEIVRNTKDIYFKLFETLVVKLQEDWM